MNNHWGKSGVPDISRPETKLLFYFLAASYIDLGIEGIHFGQVELMNKNDQQLDHYAQVTGPHTSLCRQTCPPQNDHLRTPCARRRFCERREIVDGCTCLPIRIMETPEKPEEAILKVGYTDALYGRSKGGITPSGWTCESLPYLIELDNYGASKRPGQPQHGTFLGMGI